MNLFSRSSLLIAAVLVSTGYLSQAKAEESENVWTTDYAEAKTTAEKDGKDLLILFTGSDWCPDCIRLERKVLSEEKVITELQKHFVMVYLDYPQSGYQPQKLRDQNQQLLYKYGIQMLPTFIMAHPDGKPYASSEYNRSSAKSYLKKLLKLRQEGTEQPTVVAPAGSSRNRI